MKLKYILALANALRSVRTQLSAESWRTVTGAIAAFCADTNSGFDLTRWNAYLNRKDGRP